MQRCSIADTILARWSSSRGKSVFSFLKREHESVVNYECDVCCNQGLVKLDLPPKPACWRFGLSTAIKVHYCIHKTVEDKSNNFSCYFLSHLHPHHSIKVFSRFIISYKDFSFLVFSLQPFKFSFIKSLFFSLISLFSYNGVVYIKTHQGRS